MHQVSANYTMPTILNSLQPVAANGLSNNPKLKANTASATNTSSSSTSTASGLGTTFLTLLAQELQNQDPTAPVDPTAMVGQMISLNSLQQLISIDQTLNGPVSTTPTTPTGSATPSAVAASSALGGIAGALSPSAAGAATNQLPFDPNTMMPLASGNSAATAAAINSSINATSLGFSGTNNNATGGK